MSLRGKDRRGRDGSHHVLVIVQNLSVPLDRRVWLECQALRDHDYRVTVVCPRGPGDSSSETLEGVRILRYAPPPEAKGVLGYLLEFVYAWLRTAWLVTGVQLRDPIDVLQTCNPPDTYWVLGRLLKPFGVQFVYDQHDLCPELYCSRFTENRSRVLEKLLLWLERMTYRTADRVIVTNESYGEIARRRGKVPASHITVVRSGPDPDRMRPCDPVPALKEGRSHLLCYLGVMGPQDGVDRLVRAVGILVRQLGVTDVQVAVLGFGDCERDFARAHHRARPRRVDRVHRPRRPGDDP